MASLAQSIVCSVERKKAFTSSVQMAPSKLHGIEYLAIGRRAFAEHWTLQPSLSG
jgi:hypothetical protein